MYHSGEMRWFLEGDVPAELRGWFEVGHLGRQGSARVDEYLAIPGCETVGVKIREGRFEIKALVTPGELRSYPNGVTGWREAWVKWSRGATDRAALEPLIGNEEDDWIFVSKSRSLRQFKWRDGRLDEIDAGLPPADRGCHAELTTIRAVIGSQGEAPAGPADWGCAMPWWSLALEAFGEPELVLEDIDRAASQFFRDSPPINLVADYSYPYPCWLARLYRAALSG